MKLKRGKITFLINQEYTEIQLFDSDASLVIATIRMTPEQLSSALSRLAYTECDINVTDFWDRIGKKMEHDRFVFEIESRKLTDEQVYATCVYEMKKVGKEGWFADSYFGSKDSFFTVDTEGGTKQMARATIRRWV